MQHDAAFHLVLHCLPKYSFRGFQNREVADDITHLELSFLVETTNNVFYSILMYFEHIFPRYPLVKEDETLIIQFLRASKLNMVWF